MAFPYSLSDKTVTVFIDGQTYQTDRSNPNWAKIVKAINDPKTKGEALKALITPVTAVAAAIAKTGTKKVSVKGGVVYHGTEKVHGPIALKLLDVLSAGFKIDPWIKFAENIFANPAPYAQQEFVGFFEKADLPITEDGCFLAYKMVGNDFKDLHSHTIDNSVGQIVTMPRDKVNPNRNETCSFGLHFCAKKYLSQYGNGNGQHAMILKISPADVVSIPTDYNEAKGRCCKYEVVGEIPQAKLQAHTFPKPVQQTPKPKAKTAKGKGGTKKKENDLTTEMVTKVKKVVKTKNHGTISPTGFRKLLKQHGSQSGIAKALGVSAGTVQQWKVHLLDG